MTGRHALKIASALATVVLLGACTSFYEVPIETPIQPKLDVGAFQRVLVAGFIAGGSDELDANLETVRLLRSQLAHQVVASASSRPTSFRLMDVAQNTGRPAEAEGGPADGGDAATNLPERIRDEKDMAAYERVFANVDYWKRIGEEFQNPLIVTGTVMFTPHQRSGFVTREQEVYDSVGRRRVVPVRTYMERKGFILRPKFIFIDGRTGTTLYSESFREEILYNAQQNTPALSSYFELMDRLVPGFLSTLSAQKIKGTRVLLK